MNGDMKSSNSDSSKGSSFGGAFLSIALHAVVLALVFFWGFRTVTNYVVSKEAPIQVSLSELDKVSVDKSKPPANAEKSAPDPRKIKKEREEVNSHSSQPEKKEVVPLETKKKKKEEKKSKIKQKPEKKKVSEKPKPKPKPTKKRDFEKERERIIKNIQREKVLEDLNRKSKEGGERKIQLAKSDKKIEGVEGKDSRESPAGSLVNPLISQLFTAQVHQRIRLSWNIPPGVPTDGSLVALIFFKIDQMGRVYKVRVEESSGNVAFDHYCLNAIYKSAPLPAPPPKLAKEARTEGIVVPFRNEPF